ncbi:GxxExxY protein [Tamilnaduibacter salinus]|uniref:GxxExxY protein n=1 Tax=Tamilnaduibacter salinus TaxID=1484056 RepID=A0A2U1CUV0_9GAMM|nr:GxxExxY protein [Tamilnaduibacter salinus]PVY70813.1 GxxExxY protein [Tamilnaduibacter salinus]
MLRDEELTYRIRGCIYEVYRQLGHGFLESVYQKALVAELGRQGLAVEQEWPVQIFYKGTDVGEFRLDLVVERRVILELKAQKTLPRGAETQLLNYLKATGIKLGLLANFTYPKTYVKRIILENQ